jgi:type I restriction enzyme, S subunit
MADVVDLRPDQLATVQAILETHVPNSEIWAFGSRAKWTARDSSDLDLAVVADAPIPSTTLDRLRRAFEDSYLPIKVDVLDFAQISADLQNLIRRQKVVLRKPVNGSDQARANWRTLPLEECVETIIDYRGKTPRKVSNGIPLITAKVIKDGRIETPDEFIAPEDYDGWMRRGIPRAGDVLLTMEAPLGEVAQLDDRKVALAQRLVALRGKDGLLDNWFLKYLLQSNLIQEQLKSRASGTTVLGIKQSELRKINLMLPPLSEQRAIAQVLGTLDDKIELNWQINETLETTVRILFQSWFADVTRSGMPQGWREGTLGEVAENPHRSIQPDQIESSTPYIGLEHMPRRSIALSEWGQAEELESNKFEFERGELLFGKLRPYFHKVGVAPLDGVCSTDILVITPKEPEWFGFVLGHVSSVDFVNYTDAHSTGTKMPRTNWQDIARYEVALPPQALAAKFTQAIRPLIERIMGNIHESRTLATLRAALLPKLLSGELRMTGVEHPLAYA